MSFAAGLGAALLRASLVALLAVMCSPPICRYLQARRRLALLLLLPWLTPALLVGYGWSNFSLSLLRHPFANESLLALLMLLRLLPIGVGVLYFMPEDPLSPQARFCKRLGPRRSSWASQLSFAIRGPLRTRLVVFSLVFLFAFQDLEMSSLFCTRTWTVWLLDAQVGGLSTSRTLVLSLAPLACELGIVALVITWLARTRSHRVLERGKPVATGIGDAIFTWAYLLAALTLVTLVPAAIVLGESVGGLTVLLEQFPLLEELLVSLLFASAATLFALILSRSCIAAPPWLRTPLLLLCLPGLLGPLLIALMAQGLFQLPLLSKAYDTALPLLLVLTAWLLPFGVMMHMALDRVAPHSGLHLGKLLAASAHGPQRTAGHSIQVGLRGQMRLFIALVLFVLACYELVAASLLAPIGMTPASVRLYNLMHYGQSAVLSAMVLAMLVAVISLLTLVVLARLCSRRLLARG